ncbi:futalosine hydrolase [Paenibacillus sp. D2_2]|uniref:futalosine hydrolase n=1 Tax=Paenibacillus sp. D2_2 TaxID=3073092 RepID=UPI00281629EA|nr:futalosine hydrolase [Paenibacillus sp. D2_2]WMT38922.1 futalosine hydrolase [Paenibacillus sp. D2_2]
MNRTETVFSYRNILIVTAVEAEREAVLSGITKSASDRGHEGQVKFDVQLCGVGPISAAAETAAYLAANSNYDLVISAGIGGGFIGRAEIGSIAIADNIIAADLGAETGNGFSSLDELGFGSSSIPVATALTEELMKSIQDAGWPVCIGPILTLSTVTGTQNTADDLTHRIPRAVAEAMEGYGAAFAAHRLNIPVMEIRAISNAIGPRNRELWRIGDALQALERASYYLAEVLQP